MELTLIDAEKRLNVFTEQFDDIELMANKLTIDSDGTMAIGNELISKAKQLQNSIEEGRVAIYDEIYPKAGRKVVKKANDLAKGFKARLAGVIDVVDAKYMAHRQKIKILAAQEALKAEEAQLKAKEERDKLFIPPTVDTKFDMPAPAVVKEMANMTKSDSGSSYIKKVKGFKVTEFSKVPDFYKVIDEVTVRQMMNRDGREDIPGIEWTVEEKRVTRLK